MYVIQLFRLLPKQFNTSYARNGNRLASIEQEKSCGQFCEYRRRLAVWLKQQGDQIGETCARQFEFIAAQRIRRTLQIIHLYKRIWDEVALKEFMKTWKNGTLRNTKQFLMSSIGVTMYNWDRERITDKELDSFPVSCKQEIEGIYKLRDSTVVCAKCHKRIVVDVQQPGIKYCTCYGNTFNATANQDADGWRPYIEREDMLIWRREEPNSRGLFAYKVYGSFADVTAEDFLQTQIDIDYRKKWDLTARELRIIDSDPKTQNSDDNKTDVVYWETIWPKLFANRDYVYQRQWFVDKERRLMIIISKVTEHPSAPIKPGTYRVTTYWSYMVIRPYTEFHRPGIEFGLTYFDDPGVNIPSAVTAWIAMSGLPNFLVRMRQAAKNYQAYKRTNETKDLSDVNYIPSNNEDASKCGIIATTITNNNGERMEGGKVQSKGNQEERNLDDGSSADDESTNDAADSTDDGKGLLRNLFFTKLFV